MNHIRENHDSTSLIIERAMDVGAGELEVTHPAILSCGGVFIPRPRPLNAKCPLYRILNTANHTSPTKVISTLTHADLLESIMGKERTN